MGMELEDMHDMNDFSLLNRKGGDGFYIESFSCLRHQRVAVRSFAGLWCVSIIT